MSFSIHDIGSFVPESYSRQLDERVAAQEMPYGYVDQPPMYMIPHPPYANDPPPADTGDFDQERIETKNQYPRKRGRAV